MQKIAVIFESSPFDRKGLFNSVHNRAKHLAAAGGCTVDVYCLHSRDNFLTRRIRRTPKVPHDKTVIVDGVEYRMLWYRFSILDHFRKEKLHRTPKVFDRFVNRHLYLFKGYDMISAHSFEGAYMARAVYKAYGIPYQVTWHGSDVHTHPIRNPYILRTTRLLMENASCNIFVSKALMEASAMICEDIRKTVLYNGVSSAFRRLPDEERAELRRRYGLVEDEKVVAYVGNFHKVKNVEVLPALFHRIHDDFENAASSDERLEGRQLKFWVIGDGKLRESLEPEIRCQAGAEVVFWGNMPAEKMPQMMNCIDVLVLPSRNEGLPLVVLEALKCGASVIGSAVGGIPEVAGRDSVVRFGHRKNGEPDWLGEDFVNRFSCKVTGRLAAPVEQPVSEEFDWSRTAAAELELMTRGNR